MLSYSSFDVRTMLYTLHYTTMAQMHPVCKLLYNMFIKYKPQQFQCQDYGSTLYKESLHVNNSNRWRLKNAERRNEGTEQL